MLDDSVARWMLVAHAAIGVAAVGAATHLVIWLRRYVRGQFGLARAVRKFAAIALALHALAFVAGNVLYPSYKVGVRVAYLDNEAALVAQHARDTEELDRIASRLGVAAREHESIDQRVTRAARAARWFDIKEHWVALGLIASACLWLVLRVWHPRDGGALSPVVVGLAWVIAATVWLGAILGVMTSAWRAV
jgi:hypothetical protein